VIQGRKPLGGWTSHEKSGADSVTTSASLEVKADQIIADVVAQARGLVLALRDPEAVARKLRELLNERYPARVASAYWITVEGDRDKGLDVEVRKLTGSLAVTALVGGWSLGLGIRSQILDTGTTRWSVGAAVVAPFTRLDDWKPAAYVSVRFGR